MVFRRHQVWAGLGPPSLRRASAEVGSEGAAAVGPSAPALSTRISPGPCRTGSLEPWEEALPPKFVLSLLQTPPLLGTELPREGKPLPSRETWLTSFPLSGSPFDPPVGNNAEICLLPPDEGPCRARIPSYYYDRYTQSCRKFMYGGCEGNDNNFETWEACDEACWRIESKFSHVSSELLHAPCREGLVVI